jgi:tRNA-Thr(GGU) m(6)t(6)A37 methyltransferase TsaA
LEEILVRPIGVIHTPHREQAGTPIQPGCAQGARGTVSIFEPYAEALADLAGFERIWLLYYFNRSKTWKSRVIPYRDTVERGLFATRAPTRPNPIGLSAVRLMSVEGNTLHIQDLDMLDGTPLLDIKPYVPAFDAYPQSRAGWLDASASDQRIADDRFEGGASPPRDR